MLQALNTGHDGRSAQCTEPPRDALARLETLVLMAGYDLPLRAIRQQIAAALDLIIHLERIHDGSRKVIAITEVQRMESDVITLQELYRFKFDAISSDRTVVGELVPSGLRPAFIEKFHKHGVDLPSWLANPSPLQPRGRNGKPEAYA
jgi:pilus assembly protein CpaF